MKYGLTQWCFPNGLYAFELAAKAGYDGVQVESGQEATGYYLCDPSMQEIFKEAAKRCGQEIISVVDNDIMNVGCQGDKDSEEYRNCLKIIDKTIQTAKALGCERIMLPMFKHSQIKPNDPATYERAVEVLGIACDHAADYGITVETETSIPAVMQKQLMEDIGRKNLVNLYDTQNLYWYDGLDAVKELRELLPLNGPEIHVCDGWGTNMLSGTNGASLLGEGEGHFDEQIGIICAANWDGWLILENTYRKPAYAGKGTFLELAKRDLRTMQESVKAHRSASV